jgi:hypothetical protein
VLDAVGDVILGFRGRDEDTDETALQHGAEVAGPWSKLDSRGSSVPSVCGLGGGRLARSGQPRL